MRTDLEKWDLAEDGAPRWSVPMGFSTAQGAEGGILMIEHAEDFAAGAEGRIERLQLYFSADNARKLAAALLDIADQSEAQAN